MNEKFADKELNFLYTKIVVTIDMEIDINMKSDPRTKFK